MLLLHKISSFFCILDIIQQHTAKLVVVFISSKRNHGDVSVPTDVVMKLMMPLFNNGHNITIGNYFTSLDLCLRLANKAAALSVRFDRTEGKY